MISGYGVHISAWYDHTMAEHDVDLKDHDPDSCVVVWGEDFVREPAVVIDLSTDTIVWMSALARVPENHQSIINAIREVIGTTLPEVSLS